MFPGSCKPQGRRTIRPCPCPCPLMTGPGFSYNPDGGGRQGQNSFYFFIFQLCLHLRFLEEMHIPVKGSIMRPRPGTIRLDDNHPLQRREGDTKKCKLPNLPPPPAWVQLPAQPYPLLVLCRYTLVGEGVFP